MCLLCLNQNRLIFSSDFLKSEFWKFLRWLSKHETSFYCDFSEIVICFFLVTRSFLRWFFLFFTKVLACAGWVNRKRFHRRVRQHWTNYRMRSAMLKFWLFFQEHKNTDLASAERISLLTESTPKRFNAEIILLLAKFTKKLKSNIFQNLTLQDPQPVYSVEFLLHPARQSELWAGIFKESIGARNRGGRGLSYRPARLLRLAEFIPWNRFRGQRVTSFCGCSADEWQIFSHAQPTSNQF